VIAVREATQRAIARARGENTPTLLEVRTYRFMGHSMSDAASGTYRSKEEVDEYMKRDPITLLRAQMEQRGEWSDEKMAAIDAEVRATVEDAWNFADESPEPSLDALTEDVYVDTTSDTGTSASTGER
jgi:pyruvate dehydrogenase E1 component alpha subunit